MDFKLYLYVFILWMLTFVGLPIFLNILEERLNRDSKKTNQIQKWKRVIKVIFSTFFMALAFYAIWVSNSNNEEFIRKVRVILKSHYFWGVIAVFVAPFIGKYIKLGFKPNKRSSKKDND